MVDSARTITEIDIFITRTFDEVEPEEGTHTSPALTRSVEIGVGKSAVLQEFLNPSGSSSGEQVLTYINNSVQPPDVISLSFGTHLGQVICECANPDIARNLSARSSEMWAGINTSRGESLLRVFAHQLAIDV